MEREVAGFIGTSRGVDLNGSGTPVSRSLVKGIDYFRSLDAKPRVYLYPAVILTGLITLAVSGVGSISGSLTLAIGGIALWLIWAGLLFLVAFPPADRILGAHRPKLGSIALVCLVVMLLAMFTELGMVSFADSKSPDAGRLLGRFTFQFDQSFDYTDATAMTHQAVANLRLGRNPYAHANVVMAMQEYHGATDRITPLRVGRFANDFPAPSKTELQQLWQEAALTPGIVPPELESRYNYPAGSFLLPAPFLFLGVPDLRIVYTVFVLAGIGLVARRLPRRSAIFFLAAVLVSYDIWNAITSGDTGSLFFPFLLVAWVMLPAPGRAAGGPADLWLSAAGMGTAIAIKQQAWFFLPFYAILLLSGTGIRRGSAALGVIAGIFLAMNLPFAAGNPDLWLASVLAPVRDPLFPFGAGIIALVTTGAIDISAQWPFTALEIAAGLAAIVWYWRNFRLYPSTGPLLASAPLFFAWRSMWPYFFFTGTIVLVSVLMERRAAPSGYARAAPIVLERTNSNKHILQSCPVKQ